MQTEDLLKNDIGLCGSSKPE